MPRVLLIDPDRGALAVLHAALRRAGIHEVAAATSGAFALTMLERNRPELVVSRAGVPDIDGYELCSIIRKDPSMTGVRFLLLASPGDDAPQATFDEKPDQTLAGDLPVATIVSEVTSLLRESAPAAVTRPRPTPPAASPTAPHNAPPETAPGLRGSLGVMDLPDITQAIALGHKTGELFVTLPSGRGVIVFDRGRVVHAEFFGLIGDIAFAALLVATQGEVHGSFAFNPLEAGAATVPKTVRRDLRQLLLRFAAETDEGRTGTAVTPIS